MEYVKGFKGRSVTLTIGGKNIIGESILGVEPIPLTDTPKHSIEFSGKNISMTKDATVTMYAKAGRGERSLQAFSDDFMTRREIDVVMAFPPRYMKSKSKQPRMVRVYSEFKIRGVLGVECTDL